MPGHNVFLTIDKDLQTQAEQSFDGRAGAVAAIDPRTGAVLALVSVPDYDPNLVSGALAIEEKARLDADPMKPWVNRAIQGQYAPGQRPRCGELCAHRARCEFLVFDFSPFSSKVPTLAIGATYGQAKGATECVVATSARPVTQTGHRTRR